MKLSNMFRVIHHRDGTDITARLPWFKDAAMLPPKSARARSAESRANMSVAQRRRHRASGPPIEVSEGAPFDETA